MITHSQLIFKRCFDFVFALLLLPFVIFPILISVFIATIETKQWGWFTQERVGQNAKLFHIYKIRTLNDEGLKPRAFGRFLGKSKLNELPQIFNVIAGDMSFVGPRPDLQGFADELKGDDRIILMVKPGITGPATLKYRNEEATLERQKDPEDYNRTIIWVDKVEINKKYVQNYSFYLDLAFILKSTLHK